ncbi:uncharacterized protein LOC111342762 isoform X1 [Stylophora pistillata]|uniref:ShKT domain-containing protein n=2 Tax=Stylophora pistillata TaxID=50429 RepID=A0A2B4REE3_STYPI|nr:uncharacterized protein LOC111342762 isoform X1 [Stylophora pistillata]XP_022805610.1 uncharacterized protein LOC111342762 isoform X1 [Stylophora pistillata]PFX16001.1 hypothetical protein AWC38_SpisGene19751 [Stylophora pistillata]
MAHLPAMVFLVVLESITAKYVLPGAPWFAHDIPQTKFGDREVFPSGNSEKLISAQTSMAEIKKLFESVEHMSVQSHDSTDESEGPRAWYKPQQDETVFDEGKCIDEYHDCQQFADNYICFEDVYKTWMQRKCRKTCKFCKENCLDTRYGCCEDGETVADGPSKAGCGVKLCIDQIDCERYKHKCDDDSLSNFLKKKLRNSCAYTCTRCKAPSPTADCEARRTRYGCCWNGQEALGPLEKGCLPCEDTYPRACQVFKTCNSPFYNLRKFGNMHCPKKCGMCGKCVDKGLTSKCQNWAAKGLCAVRGWKTYMEEFCPKTCGFCESSESAVDVRTLLGI